MVAPHPLHRHGKQVLCRFNFAFAHCKKDFYFVKDCCIMAARGFMHNQTFETHTRHTGAEDFTMRNLIAKTIAAHINEPHTVFVFPTGISKDHWSTRATLFSGRNAVALDRFIAWDDFKGASIKSQHKTKTAIPSVMRMVFASRLISENADTPFLKELIAPIYAQNASSFTPWISSILPSLAHWKNQFEQSRLAPDAEDADLLAIYERYRMFLERHQLFDPAWETPPFVSDGNRYIIFYPEILMDWQEYRTLLANSPDITLVHGEYGTCGKETEPKETSGPNECTPSVDFFSDTRTELHAVAAYLWNEHGERRIPWNDMAVSVPDLDTYGPYLDRELDLYEIPHTLRNGQALASSPAGSFFAEVLDCATSGFSYASVKRLLLNTSLPWRYPRLNEKLIAFGRDNNCLCPYIKNGIHVDVWNEAISAHYDELIAQYYRSLKKNIQSLAYAKTFSDINRAYFIFRSKFFDMEICPPQSDRIISRCITELGSLLDLERDFQDCTPPSPFMFFTQQLAQTMYLAEASERGVQILPYKLAATAPFSCHVVVDATQASISVVYRELSFLNEAKRRLLGIADDPDVSSKFIELYKTSAIRSVYFTAAEKTISGYGLCHGSLHENDRRTERLPADFFAQERNALLRPDSADFPAHLFAVQKNGFLFWTGAQSPDTAAKGNQVQHYIAAALDKFFEAPALPKFSATMLNRFFRCPRSWFLHSVVGVQEQVNEAELISPFTMGNLYHKVFEYLCKALKEQRLSIPADATWEEPYATLLSESVAKAVNDPDIKKLSPLSQELIKTTQSALEEKMRESVEGFFSAFASCTVCETESTYSWSPKDIPCTCTGRIDCLLKSPDSDEYILVDFKSSSHAIPSDNLYANDPDDIPDMQLPMYIELLEANKKKVENAAFFDVRNGKAVGVFGAAVYKDEIDFKPTRERFLELLSIALDRIKRHDLSVTRSVPDFDTCVSCAYQAVCRRTFTVSPWQC